MSVLQGVANVVGFLACMVIGFQLGRICYEVKRMREARKRALEAERVWQRFWIEMLRQSVTPDVYEKAIGESTFLKDWQRDMEQHRSRFNQKYVLSDDELRRLQRLANGESA